MKLLKQVLWTLRIRGYCMLWQWTVNQECWFSRLLLFQETLAWSLKYKSETCLGLIFGIQAPATGCKPDFVKKILKWAGKWRYSLGLFSLKYPELMPARTVTRAPTVHVFSPPASATFQGDLPKSLPWWLWDGTEPTPLCNQSQCSWQAHHFTSAQRSSSRFPEWNSRVGLVRCPQEKVLPYGYQPATFIPSLQHNFKDVWSLQAWDLWNMFYNWDWLVLVLFWESGSGKGQLKGRS